MSNYHCVDSKCIHHVMCAWKYLNENDATTSDCPYYKEAK
jgi:hypothetical protein